MARLVFLTPGSTWRPNRHPFSRHALNADGIQQALDRKTMLETVLSSTGKSPEKIKAMGLVVPMLNCIHTASLILGPNEIWELDCLLAPDGVRTGMLSGYMEGGHRPQTLAEVDLADADTGAEFMRYGQVAAQTIEPLLRWRDAVAESTYLVVLGPFFLEALACAFLPHHTDGMKNLRLGGCQGVLIDQRHADFTVLQ